MATKSYSIANFSQVSTWKVVWGGSSYIMSPAPSIDTDYASVVISDIPTGSVINSAYLQATLGSASTGAAIRTVAFSLDAGAYSTDTVWDSLGPPATEAINVSYIAVGGTTNIKFRFKANGSLSPTGDRSSSLSYSDITLNVDYTPPTAASLSNVRLDNSASAIYKGAGAGATLSWDASNGTNNPISSYTIHYRDNGGSWVAYATGVTAKSYTVYGHPTAGNNRQFLVTAIAPYGNSGDVASPIMYAYSAVGTPTGVGISPTAVFPGNSATLSWNAVSGGVGTSVIGYYVFENGVAKAQVAGTSYTFSAPGVGSYVYTVYAIANVTGYNSGASAGTTLTVEPPASSFSLDKSTVPMDDASTITATIAPVNSAYNHDVTFAIDGTRTSTANVAAGSTTRIFTVPLDWCVGVPNATSKVGTCTVVTKNGSTVIGQTSRTFTVTVPASVVPTASLAVAPLDGFNGLYLKGISKARLTSTDAGAQGSTISSRSLYGGGYSGSSNPFDTGVLNTVGSNTMTVVVTDSRNRQATDTEAITVLDYAPPSISGVFAFRSDDEGNLLDSGEYIAVIANLSVSAITGNSGSATVRKRVSGGAWGSPEAITHDTTVVLSGALQQNAYQVEITHTDTVGTVSTYSTVVRPAKFMYDFRMDRSALGRLAGAEKTFLLPDDWTTNIALIVRPIGNIYESVDSTSPATLFGGTWASMGGRFLIGADGTYTAGSTGGAATHTHPVSGTAAIANFVGYSDINMKIVSSHNWQGNQTSYAGSNAINEYPQRSVGVEVVGTAASESSLPPYESVYMWKRTA